MAYRLWGNKGLRCLAIAANALWAGGLYCFPLFSPALVQHHHFTQSQLTTIALAGMVGQYPFAALVGKVLDTRGARTCSLVAALMFSLGFGLFAYEIADAKDSPTEDDTMSVFRRMVVYYGMVGLGTVFAYFSIVFSATQTFPHYIGVASGTSMALFGCSPLLLSLIADHFFTFPDSTGAPVLNVTRFLTFLSLVSGVAHLFGALTLPGISSTTSLSPATDVAESPVGEAAFATEEALDSAPPASAETSPLLSRRELASEPSPSRSPKKSVDVDVVEISSTAGLLEATPPQHGTSLQLLRDWHFWGLILVVAILVGCCEMVIANMSSIFLSLRTSGITSLVGVATQRVRATTRPSITTQVQLLSLTNTMSRLVVGPLADLVAPVPVPFQRPSVQLSTPSPSSSSGANSPNAADEEAALLEVAASSKAKETQEYYAFPRRHYISRVAFLLGASTLLLVVFSSFLGIHSNGAEDSGESMSLLSVGVGIAYGTTFTVLPGILSAVYGSTNLGRNFGIISYAPFVGTSFFSYLYAFLADRHASSSESGFADVAEEVRMCRGPQCWQTTFSVCIAALALAIGVAGLLWRKWKGRL